MVLTRGLMFAADILGPIQDFIVKYRDIALKFFNELTSVWLQAAILVGLALFAVIGLFVFSKKFIKLFVVLGVLGAVFYYLWSKGIIQDLWSNVTGAVTYLLMFK
jgi:hypothetical protein